MPFLLLKQVCHYDGVMNISLNYFFRGRAFMSAKQLKIILHSHCTIKDDYSSPPVGLLVSQNLELDTARSCLTWYRTFVWVANFFKLLVTLKQALRLTQAQLWIFVSNP